MTRADLELRLHLARTCDESVAALAEFFAAHDLVFGHGTDNASDEAFWLLRHLQGWRDGVWDAPLDPALRSSAVELAVRRAMERKPLAYLTGEAWFAGLRFRVDERVLVPRSPLAEVIERGFEPWCAPRAGDRVLDIGTGSGCIAIAAAHYCPEVRVDATDVSPAALAVAAANVALHGVGDRVRLLETDLFPAGRERYRVIVANPPYVPEAQLDEMPEEFGHEPRLALSGGADGLRLAQRVLAGARRRLAPGGVLLLEVGGTAGALAAAYPNVPFTWLEFERGGDGVCVFGESELQAFPRGG